MQRKLVKMGEHSLMSTIPKKWVDKHQLQAGDSIQFSELDNKLIISSSKEVFEKRAEISLDIPKIEITWRVIQPYYTSGYDELIINYKDQKTLDLIERNIDGLIGWEIIEITQKKVIIKSVSTANDDINPLIKRCWFILKHMANILDQSFEQRDKKSFERLRTIEYSMNKYTMLIKRIINRTGYKYHHYIYMIVNYFDLTANHMDYIRRLFEREPKTKIYSHYKKASGNLLQLIDKTYELYYSFKQEDFNWIALEQPHFFWFKELPEGPIKGDFIAASEYLVQIARHIHALHLQVNQQ